MLNMSAAHLKELRKSCPSKRLVWVDIGGGTGKQKITICRSTS